jgi:hypothetical protein
MDMQPLKKDTAMPFYWKPTDNTNPLAKIYLRKWLLDFFPNPRVLDVYGGHGVMYDNVWKESSSRYEAVDGKVIRWIKKQENLEYDVFDIDPWGSPFQVIAELNKRIAEDIGHVGMVCTDGAIKRAGQIIPLSRFVREKCGFDEKNKTFLRSLFHQYNKYLRFILEVLLPDWEIERLAIKHGQPRAMVYFAGVFNRKKTS